jgi:cytochrome c556
LKAAAVGFLVAAALASAASAQDAPSEVTDAEIARYKATAQMGCRQAGMAKGDPQAQVDAFCNCVLQSLEKTMKRPEWQQAAFYSLRNDENGEKKVLAPHVQNLAPCRG